MVRGDAVHGEHARPDEVPAHQSAVPVLADVVRVRGAHDPGDPVVRVLGDDADEVDQRVRRGPWRPVVCEEHEEPPVGGRWVQDCREDLRVRPRRGLLVADEFRRGVLRNPVPVRVVDEGRVDVGAQGERHRDVHLDGPPGDVERLRCDRFPRGEEHSGIRRAQGRSDRGNPEDVPRSAQWGVPAPSEVLVRSDGDRGQDGVRRNETVRVRRRALS